jgi:hypothetical protein
MAEMTNSADAGQPEIYRGAQNLTTQHAPEHYPGIQVVLPFEWSYAVIIPQDGQSFTALGGERLLPYQTADGAVAQGFTLSAGDRVTRVRSDLPHAFAEWHVLRNALDDAFPGEENCFAARALSSSCHAAASISGPDLLLCDGGSARVRR